MLGAEERAESTTRKTLTFVELSFLRGERQNKQ